MRREDLTLIMLALADGGSYTPVQIQKAMFLADDLVRDVFDSRYDFQPYDYGPFDSDVYRDAKRMEADGLTELDVAESILNAVAIYKKLRSTSRFRTSGEYLYVIQSPNLDGLAIYSKGKLVKQSGVETYYFLVSSKRAV